MKRIICLTFFLLVVVVSCATSSRVNIESDVPAQIIAERAYEQFANKNYKSAILHYETIISRFDRQTNPKDVAWAYYEIGFCYYYQKKYVDAIKYFNIVLNEFAILPARILAQKVLDDIYEQKPKLKPEEDLSDSVLEL